MSGRTHHLIIRHLRGGFRKTTPIPRKCGLTSLPRRENESRSTFRLKQDRRRAEIQSRPPAPINPKRVLPLDEMHPMFRSPAHMAADPVPKIKDCPAVPSPQRPSPWFSSAPTHVADFCYRMYIEDIKSKSPGDLVGSGNQFISIASMAFRCMGIASVFLCIQCDSLGTMAYDC